MIFEGNVWKLGDDIDTDVIIAARYLSTSDAKALAEHCLEDLIPGFAAKVQPGDVIVGGRNFGCGSSREHAPRVFKTLGVSAIIAKSYARIFFRNSFNIGFPLIQATEAVDSIENGDRLKVDLAKGTRSSTRPETRNSASSPSPNPCSNSSTTAG